MVATRTGQSAHNAPATPSTPSASTATASTATTSTGTTSNAPATTNAPAAPNLNTNPPAAPNLNVNAPTTSNLLATNPFPHDFKTRKVNLESIDKLEGLKDLYDDWSHQVAMLLSALRLNNVVINGATLTPTATTAEKETYQTMVCDALYLLTQVVSKPIMRMISRITNPHEIWAYLKTTYYRDSGFNFVGHMSSLFPLPEKLNGSNLETFIDKYEHHYDRLRNLVAASKFEEHNSHFLLFLNSDRAKRNFLLTTLSKKYPNVVDNLTTKDSLKFEEVDYKLRSLHTDLMLNPSSIEQRDTAALITQSQVKFNKSNRLNKFNRIHKNQGRNDITRNGGTRSRAFNSGQNGATRNRTIRNGTTSNGL